MVYKSAAQNDEIVVPRTLRTILIKSLKKRKHFSVIVICKPRIRSLLVPSIEGVKANQIKSFWRKETVVPFENLIHVPIVTVNANIA